MKTAFAALLLLCPLTAAAQQNDVAVLLGGAAFEETTIVAFLPEDVQLDLTFENGRSFALAYNRFWRESFSTEFAILGLETDPTLSIRSGPIDAAIDIGNISVGAFTVTPQWHFRRDARVSPYLGAGVALLSGEFETEFEDDFGDVTATSAEFEGAAGFLLNGGLNIRMTERWLFAIDVKVIPYSPEIDSDSLPETPDEEIVITDELDLNPVIVSLGVRYRF